TPPSPCIWTVCAATTVTILPKPCSRHSAARCAAPSRATNVLATACLPPRVPSESSLTSVHHGYCRNHRLRHGQSACHRQGPALWRLGRAQRDQLLRGGAGKNGSPGTAGSRRHALLHE